jgi:DNA-binding response OmpR family regulator
LPGAAGCGWGQPATGVTLYGGSAEAERVVCEFDVNPAAVGVHTKLARISHATFTITCCDEAMTADDGSLLVVDDELFLRGAVAASLRFLGFEVSVAENGTDALRLARANPFDLLVLDVVLPDIDGFEIVRRLRREGNLVPVIFLTAKDTQDDKVTGLTIGGDDYMTKPFGLEELAARVRTVLRRTRPAPAEPVLTFADLTLDQDTYEVRRGGRLIELSPTGPRVGLRLRRIQHRGLHLRHLPAAQAGRRRARPNLDSARRRLQPAAATPERSRRESGGFR